MTTGGGGGMESGDDFVSQRLSFEFDPRGLANLREMNTELDRYRTNTEAAGRATESFSRYVQLLGEAHERTIQVSKSLTQTLERMAEIQGRMSGQTADTPMSTSTAIPPNYVAPFSGVTAGMGGGERGRIPTTTPAPEPWSQLAERDPRAFLNARAAWGGGRGGEMPSQVSIDQVSIDRLAARLNERDHQQQRQAGERVQQAKPPQPSRPQAGAPAWESWRNRASNWIGGANNVMSAFAPGGGGILNLASRGLSNFGSRYGREDASVDDSTGGSQPPFRPADGAGFPSVPHAPHGGSEEEGDDGGGGGGIPGLPGMGGGGGGKGGAMGGLGKAAGVGGAVLGTIGGIWAGIQKTGQHVQQYRALGETRGGGFSEGMGYEMQARMMALNPFITNEQSRSIIQSALTHGYTGKEFDTVTKYMADNLKDMNLSVADSTKLLQSSVLTSRDNIGKLAKDLNEGLGVDKDLAKKGFATLPEREAAVMNSLPALTSQGVTGPTAQAFQSMVTEAFSDMPGMSEAGSEAVKAVSGNMAFTMSMLAHGGQGGTVLKVPGLKPGDPEGVWEALAKQGPGATDAAFWWTLSWTAHQCHGNMTVWDQRLKLYGINLTRPQQEAFYEKAMAVGTGGPKDPLSAIGAVQNKKGEKEHQSDAGPGQARQRWMNQNRGLGGPVSPYAPGGTGPSAADRGTSPDAIIDKIVKAYGGDAEVGGTKGHDWQAFDPTNEQQMKDLAEGKVHVRRPGDKGPGVSISQVPGGDSGTGSGSGRGGSAHGSGMKGTLAITVHPANLKTALGLPDHVPLTANEQAANAGYGTAQKNNPPPGDSIPATRGAR